MAKCKDLTELSTNTKVVSGYKKLKHTESEEHPVYKETQRDYLIFKGCSRYIIDVPIFYLTHTFNLHIQVKWFLFICTMDLQ